MANHSAHAIRQGFLDFFHEKAGHTVVPSSPVIPYDDPTLLFTNAGMNQFKDVFLGQGTRAYCRAVDSQKCIRAGGKHNDLEDVGRDTSHHTFFEMLGNWSFGDYFKEEAIRWAWELLTDVWGLDRNRLYATVFAGDSGDGLGGDETAEHLWRDVTDIDPSHITRWDRKDNFWEMGATGPCGPCSEIHYDSTPDGSGGALVNLDHPDVIEIWNLVFIQYNRGDDGSLVELPARHIDTGMGLERVTRILQGKRSNYDTDLWTPIFEHLREVADAPAYSGGIENPVDIAYRVLADHARCLSVAISDGARLGNEGREYVLRRILRRGVRIARQAMGVDGVILASLVDPVVETLGQAFPELKEHQSNVKAIIASEEEAFLRTLDRGLTLFDRAATVARSAGTTSIPAEEAFTLHDTYGFPIDLTEVMAAEQGLTVDRGGYDTLMNAARAASRHGPGGPTHAQTTLPPETLAALTADDVSATDDSLKYERNRCGGTIMAIWDGETLVETIPAHSPCGVILDQTCFYAQQGGQIGDQGTLTTDSESPHIALEVADTTRVGPFVLHQGTTGDTSLDVGAAVTAEVSPKRREEILANHTATHLLNLALRRVLGNDVQQRGSLVAEDRLRFDFSHPRSMSLDEVGEVQSLVRAAIDADLTVHTQDMPLEQGMAINGVRAVFGERYPDPVRVVAIGPSIGELLDDPHNAALAESSIEFCGGIHLPSTQAARSFAILSEAALAAGIRRLTAVTGDAAITAINHGALALKEAQALAACDDQTIKDHLAAVEDGLQSHAISMTDRATIEPMLESARARLRDLDKDSSRSRRTHVVSAARDLASDHDGSDVLVGAIDDADKESLLAGMDAIRAARPESAIMLFGPDLNEGKVAIVATVSPDLIRRGLRAGDWIKEAAKACGGGGGGRPDSAQAGGKDPALVPAAIDIARQIAAGTLEDSP